jgi:tRNA(Ile)-lysidine synthase TilS/MesJ
VKCSRCRAPAQVRLPRIKAGFCPDCFKLYVERQAAKAVKQFELIRPGDKVLVAVSGGKDSLGLWDLLLKAGVRADGLYIHLGIGDYSVRSGEKAKNFAAQRQVTLHVVDLPAKDEAVPDLAPFGPRSFCSTCGTIKRHYFNRAAAEGGFTVLATGHNLDDEEMAAYCFLSGIDYIIEECPHAKGATSIKYKQVLHHIEALMPGTKWNFYAEFQSRRALFAPGPAISSASPDDTDAPPPPDARWRQCSVCGQPSWLEVCGFCRLKGRRAGSESPD